ncbi:hypothetical protein BG58_37195 [Caballeronia jiangsuensis]|nr:hypothetical protein BG58_37195 [Caballeronia jiangsuensis]
MPTWRRHDVRGRRSILSVGAFGVIHGQNIAGVRFLFRFFGLRCRDTIAAFIAVIHTERLDAVGAHRAGNLRRNVFKARDGLGLCLKQIIARRSLEARKKFLREVADRVVHDGQIPVVGHQWHIFEALAVLAIQLPGERCGEFALRVAVSPMMMQMHPKLDVLVAHRLEQLV